MTVLELLQSAQGLKSAEKAAQQVTGKVDAAAVPVRAYLEQTVVPVLMAGLQQLVRERPEDPVDYLASYLQQNNPRKPAGPSASQPV
jgi:protein dpy-30